MDRNREARRASIVGSNGFNRRRHRTNSLRDSPDEDWGLELQESVRLRDRVKKDRDRERERDSERERERERDLRERSSRSKRRIAERLRNNREDTGGDETSEESVNDEEDDEDEENTTAAATGVRLLTPAVGSISNHQHHHHDGHLSNHHHSHSSRFSQQQHNSNSTSNIVSSNQHLQHRKSFPPSSSSAKVLRAPPVWKSADEMISVSVPRKARSASTKRSHDWISSSSNSNGGGGVSGGEQNLGQPSSSLVRQGVVSTATPLPVAPMTPSSSNSSIRKKLKPSVNNTGSKLKPPKVSSKPSSSNPEELEIEIAEVLYGLMTQSQGLSSKKEDWREINRLSNDAKSRNSSPISNSTSPNNPILGPNSSPLSAVAPRSKRPRQVPESSIYGARSIPISVKPDTDQTAKSEMSSPNLEEISGSAAENRYEMAGNSVNSQGPLAEPPAPTPPESAKSDSEFKPVAEELMESRDLVAKEEVSSPKEKESPAVRAEDSNNGDSPLTATASSVPTMIKANSMVAEMENQKEEKFEIDLMAPPPQVRSSLDRETKVDSRASPVDQKPVVSIVDAHSKLEVSKDQEDEKGKSGSGKDHSSNTAAEEKKDKGSGEEAESQLQNQKQQQQQMPLKATREEPLTEKSGHSTSTLLLPMSMAGWPGGLPPMGYMAPEQGVVSMDGTVVTPGHIQPLFSQPRPKCCATHYHIAKNIHYLQQFMKMNPFWPAPAGSASLFGSKPCNLNAMPAPDLHGNITVRGGNNSQDKGQSLASIPNHGGKKKGSQPTNTSDSAQRKQQILFQQPLPPIAPSNLLGPTFIFPLNQQQSAVAARPSSAKSPATGASSNTYTSVTNASSAAAMSFNYPNMASNETQYLAILQNNAYPFPIPAVGAPPNYSGNLAQAMPLLNGSFYSSHMIHSSQLQRPQQPSIHSLQLLQAHQNESASSGFSSSLKHLQSQQQQRTQSGGVLSGSGSASLQNFSSQKTQLSQQLQQSHNQYGHSSRPRHLDGELASEDSPSTTNSRGSRASMNIYGPNFAMPIHPQNFALMTPPASLASTSAAAANQIDKNAHQQGLKTGADALPPYSFAMSFGPINGTTAESGIDITSMA